MSGLPLLGHTGLDATFAWLPDGPRSAGQYLADVAALQALLAEQRRTNRLLQALLYGAAGFIGGAVLMRVWLQWAAA